MQKVVELGEHIQATLNRVATQAAEEALGEASERKVLVVIVAEERDLIWTTYCGWSHRGLPAMSLADREAIAMEAIDPLVEFINASPPAANAGGAE